MSFETDMAVMDRVREWCLTIYTSAFGEEKGQELFNALTFEAAYLLYREGEGLALLTDGLEPRGDYV